MAVPMKNEMDPMELLEAHGSTLAASDSPHNRAVAAAIDWALGEIRHAERHSEPAPRDGERSPSEKKVPEPRWLVFVIDRDVSSLVLSADQNAYDAKITTAAHFGALLEKIGIEPVNSKHVDPELVVIWRDEFGSVVTAHARDYRAASY